MSSTPFAAASTANTDDLQCEGRLAEWLRALPQAPLIAFSGGVDSSYLLAVAAEVLGPQGLRAVLGVSPSLSAAQREQAEAVAHALAVTLDTVATDELERPEYRANLGDRCFHCKDTLFATLRAMAPEAVLLDGTQADDAQGHRPGSKAAALHGVRSPLFELAIGKAAIRRLSARRQLITAELPAAPCLASRFPAGTPVSLDGLKRVEAAEALLRDLGFHELRVRHHDGGVARIEVPLAQAPQLLNSAAGRQLVDGLKKIGFRFVTLDLEGFRSGSSSTMV